MVTIYALRDPDTDAVRYIGSTNDAEMRRAAHVTKARKLAVRSSERLSRLDAWLKELGEAGKSPGFTTIEQVSDAMRLEAENKWIEHYSQVSPLLNAIKANNHPRNHVNKAMLEMGLCTFTEAMRLTTLGFDDLKRLVAEGVLETYKVSRGITKYLKYSELDDYIENGKVPAKSRQVVSYVWLSANAPDIVRWHSRKPDEYGC
jgi:hypothetical protein